MSNNTNVVVVTGNLGCEVDFRVFPQSGSGVSEFRVAISKYRPNDQGGFETYTTWVSVKMFGKLAERARDKLVKGAKVALTGELSEDSWEDTETGKRRSKLVIVANAFEVLSTPNAARGDDFAGDREEVPEVRGAAAPPAPRQPARQTPASAARRSAGPAAAPAPQQAGNSTRPVARPPGY